MLQRFYRANGSPVPGAGLGLSIVKRICELYGAELALRDGDGDAGLCVEVVFRSADLKTQGPRQLGFGQPAATTRDVTDLNLSHQKMPS